MVETTLLHHHRMAGMATNKTTLGIETQMATLTPVPMGTRRSTSLATLTPVPMGTRQSTSLNF
jgi:hypothetical protein